MRTFVLRARAAPTDSQRLLAGVGGDAHTEILAHSLMNAIFVAQSHREDVVVHLVLESTPDFSRTVTIVANELRDLDGFHERALLDKVALALDASRGMCKDTERPVEPGITVRTLGFEKLVQQLAENHQLYVMARKGDSIRQLAIAKNPCFLLTDHIPMPKKSLDSLKRKGARQISLGPRMLFASQCIVLIHNQLDLLDHRS
jgi:tRNA (pseudouridine54-N1)-methyltransferase